MSIILAAANDDDMLDDDWSPNIYAHNATKNRRGFGRGCWTKKPAVLGLTIVHRSRLVTSVRGLLHSL